MRYATHYFSFLLKMFFQDCEFAHVQAQCQEVIEQWFVDHRLCWFFPHPHYAKFHLAGYLYAED